MSSYDRSESKSSQVRGERAADAPSGGSRAQTKPSMWRLRATWALVALGVSAIAVAQITPVHQLSLERPNAAQLESAVAGSTGNGTTVIQLDRTAPLVSLTTAEYDNRPRAVRANFIWPHWNHQTDGWDFSARTLRSWSSHNATANAQTADIYEGAPRGEMRFVRGIAVCPSSGALTDNDRVKGVRLYWGTVPPGATSTRQISTRGQDVAEFRRPNCNNNNGWLPAQMCPTGQVATGLKVLHQGNHGAVGFQLLCDHLRIMTDEEGRAEFQRLNPGGSISVSRGGGGSIGGSR